MLQIANPTYDVVFKYLLEDMRVAKLILSTIIGENIEELDFSATERTRYIPKDKDAKLDHILTVCRFDFSAKIKTARGYKTVTIELQKAKYASDIERFRRYLAKHYEAQDNSYQEGRRRKPRQIYAIYLLNYDINLPDCPVINVDIVAKDVASGTAVTTDNEFIKGLHHKSWIVQMTQLKKRRRNKLEELLDVFCKGAENEKKHSIYIRDEDVPEEFGIVIRRLLHAQADEGVRGSMDLEDEIIEELRERERDIGGLRDVIAEKEKTIEANRAVLEAKDAALGESKAALEAQAREIAELRKLVAKAKKPSK